MLPFFLKELYYNNSMENDNKREVALKIYNLLMSQSFTEWYENDFMDHVYGEESCKSSDEIIKDIIEQI